MKCKYILFFIILITACKQKREVDTSFYYWKTVYKQNKEEIAYLKEFKSKKLYVRIMDVDNLHWTRPVPIAPISFADTIPRRLEIVPVVFIVNDILQEQNKVQVKQLALNILAFVKGKLEQGGVHEYKELQIDCDWTSTTRIQYFSLLNEIRKLNKRKVLSSTLRLHQLKNQVSAGIPPVDKVLLMCYNMGNLRAYGNQNSILDVNEIKKYVNKNLSYYPMGIDVALPLFSWAVVFRRSNYSGISKRIKLMDLKKPKLFNLLTTGLYQAKLDLPDFGIKKDEEIRYEESKIDDLKGAARYLSSNLSEKPLNLVYYHLDYTLLKNYTFNELEEVSHLLR